MGCSSSVPGEFLHLGFTILPFYEFVRFLRDSCWDSNQRKLILVVDLPDLPMVLSIDLGSSGFFLVLLSTCWKLWMIFVWLTLWLLHYLFVYIGRIWLCPDRSTGRIGGINPDNGGVVDAKNLRVKVRLCMLRCKRIVTNVDTRLRSSVLDFFWSLFCCWWTRKWVREDRISKSEQWIVGNDIFPNWEKHILVASSCYKTSTS